jgi:hypothetical protein
MGGGKSVSVPVSADESSGEQATARGLRRLRRTAVAIEVRILQEGGMMEQLLLHLVGDYVTQTDWMAREKVRRNFAAAVHAFVYALPFLLLTSSAWALFVICSTHFLIDRFRLARYVVFAKNWATDPSLKWADCSTTGYSPAMPPWLAVWLLIIADNTMHLCINYAALRWL